MYANDANETSMNYSRHSHLFALFALGYPNSNNIFFSLLSIRELNRNF